MDTIEIGDLPGSQDMAPLQSSFPSHSRHVDLEIELLTIPLNEIGVGLQARSFVAQRRVISIAGLPCDRLSAALAFADDLGGELSAVAVVDAILQADSRIAQASGQSVGGLRCAALRLLSQGRIEWATLGNVEVSILQGIQMVMVTPENTIHDIAAGTALLTSSICVWDQTDGPTIGPKALAHLISGDNNFSSLAVQASSVDGSGSLIAARRIAGSN